MRTMVDPETQYPRRTPRDRNVRRRINDGNLDNAVMSPDEGVQRVARGAHL